MKSSERTNRVSHLAPLLIAFLTAAVMWYLVSVRDRLEAQLEVNLDYYGIPAHLVITDGLISKVSVRLRGPEILLRSATQRKITQAVNLSGIKKGSNVVPLTQENLGPNFRAFEMIDVQPPRIVIKADTLVERSVSVRPHVESPLRTGVLTVENLSVSPASVMLRGPESVVADLSSIPLIVTLDPKAAGTTVGQTLSLDTPGMVTATPSSVRVQYSITSGRTVVSRHCKVEIAGENRRLYTVEPEEVVVRVEVPEALGKNNQYLSQLGVSVMPPDMEADESRKVDLRFRLPEGMTLLNPAIDTVTLTRKKK